MASSPERVAAWEPPYLAVVHGSAPAVAGPWAPPDLSLFVTAPEPPDTPGNAGRAELEQAWRRGYDEGTRRGVSEATELLEPGAEALRRVVERLETAESAFARDRAAHVEALALAVARKLVQREIQADPSLVRDLVAQALTLVPHDTMIEIRVHPLDLEAVGTALEHTGMASGAVTLEWIPDPGLDRGSFMLETPQRLVDGRADVALRQLFERLDHE
jgi:flagellar biosynthesis/type III secretory pathway protein FliH